MDDTTGNKALTRTLHTGIPVVYTVDLLTIKYDSSL